MWRRLGPTPALRARPPTQASVPRVLPPPLEAARQLRLRIRRRRVGGEQAEQTRLARPPRLFENVGPLSVEGGGGVGRLVASPSPPIHFLDIARKQMGIWLGSAR